MAESQAALNALKDKGGILQKNREKLFFSKAVRNHMPHAAFRGEADLAQQPASTKRHCPAHSRLQSCLLVISPSISNKASLKCCH